jgi:hypothetical protein
MGHSGNVLEVEVGVQLIQEKGNHMKRLMVVSVLGVLLVLAGGCAVPGFENIFLVGSGNDETRTFDFADFTQVQASSAFRVTITRGEEYSVAVTADEEAWQVVDVQQQGGRVTLGLSGLASIRNATLEAEITMPMLEEFSLSGAARGNMTGFASTQPFVADLSGASVLEGDIGAADVRLSLSGASRTTLAGAGDTLMLEASGSSKADLEAFPVNDADVRLSGASSATVNPAGTLSVNGSGASRLTYVGSPTMGNVDLSGASEITQR